MRHGWLHPRAELRPLVWAKRTDHRWECLRGLLGLPAPARGTGLVITPAHGVHTFGLGYALDVVFFDIRWRILAIERAVRPCRWIPAAAAAHVLALSAGEADRLGLAAGQDLDWLDDIVDR